MGITISTKKIYFFGETEIDSVSHIPLLSTIFINPNIKKLSSYDFIIITSKRSIEAMLSFNYNFNNIDIFCIGEKTAAFAKKQNLNVKHISKGYAKDLVFEIVASIKAKKGLYLRPKEVANEYITNYVSSGDLDEAICYETHCLGSNLSMTQPAILLFAAPSQVKCFMKYFTFDKNDIIIAIGQTTAKALPIGIKYHISRTPSLDALTEEALFYRD